MAGLSDEGAQARQELAEELWGGAGVWCCGQRLMPFTEFDDRYDLPVPDPLNRSHTAHRAIHAVSTSVITYVLAERERWNSRLVGKTEIARQFDVSVQRIDELHREHPDFPAPLVRLAMGPVFAQSDIDHFRANAPRYSGGRRRRW